MRDHRRDGVSHKRLTKSSCDFDDDPDMYLPRGSTVLRAGMSIEGYNIACG